MNNTFRIGNDIQIVWNVLKNGSPADLSGKEVKLYMTHPRGREEIQNKNVSGSSVTCTIDGLKQEVLGWYTLTLDVRNNDNSRYMIKDACRAFQLAGRSCVETNEGGDYIINISL